jgi:hypothetical protein
LKVKITELKTNNKNKNIRDLYRGINEFKCGYMSTSNVVEDENVDLLTDLKICKSGRTTPGY